jgi:hypothetical protein
MNCATPKSGAGTHRTPKACAKHFARSALECGGLTPLWNYRRPNDSRV